MTMYDEDKPKSSKRVSVECKNPDCKKFISYMMVPSYAPIVAEFYCNLKCIEDHEKIKKTKKKKV
jgi:hypothetical protein